MGQPEQLGRVTSAEPEGGERSDCFNGLLLRFRAGALGSAAGPHYIVRDRCELGRELVADAQFDTQTARRMTRSVEACGSTGRCV